MLSDAATGNTHEGDAQRASRRLRRRFHLVIECAQACVAFMRQADSQCAIPSFKEKCRATSNKAVQRPEKIKGLRQHLKAAKQSLQIAHAQQDVLVQSEELPFGRCRAWSDELASHEALARIEWV
jgi:hypothetical protein